MIQLFRPVNLLIVAITQFFLQYFVLVPALSEINLSPSLDFIHFSLLVISTVLVAGGGYIVNDILDYEADIINKPENVVINKSLNKTKGWTIYWITTFLGGIIALYLANQVDNLLLFFIYPVAVLLLYLYSLNFKKKPIIGNLVVSTFCAGVAGLVLFAEREQFYNINYVQQEIKFQLATIFLGYIIFAFISTFLREVVKDIEDIEGDQMIGAETFPVKYGIKKAVKLTIVFNLLLLAGVLISAIWLWIYEEYISSLFLCIFILPVVIYLNILLFKSKSKKDFSRTSTLIKVVMLFGLILLCLIWKF